MAHPKQVVAFAPGNDGNVPLYVSERHPLPVLGFTVDGNGEPVETSLTDPVPVKVVNSSGERSFRISIPIANLEDDEGFGAGLIRLDNKDSIDLTNVNTNASDGATLLEMLVLLGGAGVTEFQLIELSVAKADHEVAWNETARIYRYDGNFNFVGDLEEGILRWESNGNEPNNQLNGDQLYIDFINNVEDVAQINMLIGF